MLEVGAGLGDFSSQLVDRDRVVVTDVDPEAVDSMARRFSGRPGVQARRLDAATLTPQRAEQLTSDQGAVDSVLAINVLEHIENDVDTLQALSRLVRPGGTVIQWVPGYMNLYGDFDRSVGHVRRYTPKTLAAAGHQAGPEVRSCRPVNLLGGVAWWAAVRRGGTGTPKPGLVKIYDSVVVPITRILDRFPIPFGQSVLGVFTRS
ncbi:class I SAM-dependent methyltransferase [Microlunatus elymi]|uniref:class I SAM-dependent methyltransferase n=1 Tax=Microlunatus elymi TaxID=2596828 RepID=UPI001AEFD584|nr:class I SAM-dependent methyltransferase [Microlunatus elymi]